MPAATTIAPARSTSVQAPTPSAPEIVAPRVDSPDSDSQPVEAPVSDSQCMKALARANEVRLARAALKREVAAGQREVVAVVRDLPWEAHSMCLAELLCSQRRWGRARSRKLLNSVGLAEGKRLGSLTERQQGILVGALEAKSRERVVLV